MANYHRWSLRRTIISCATIPEDFCVLRDGVCLGRVHRAPYVPKAPPFIWASWPHPAQSGRADSLDAALDLCRNAIGDLPVPQHIQRSIKDYTYGPTGQ